MARRRRRKSSRRIWLPAVLVTVAGVWSYGRFVSPVLEGDATDVGRQSNAPGASSNDDNRREHPSVPKLTSHRPEQTAEGSPGQVAEKGGGDLRESVKARDPESARRAAGLYEAGIRELAGGDLVAARAHLSEAIKLGVDGQNLLEARAALMRIGTQTIFSNAILPDDPFVRRHVVSSGETLNRIAQKFDVTDDFLAAINDIHNKDFIRAGRTIKVVHGPFHARIDKQSHRIDVYLQTTLVRHYPVGLGANNATPLGTWIVGTKLTNPTYYPPDGGDIVAADDPENPLGEHWIELKGVSGDALGQQRYGIHGTNDPDSIGRDESLGCIRMHNADVTELYSLLVPEKSQVTVE